MKKHADNAKKDTRKSQLPVSKNFYSCVTGRVCESLGLIGRPDAVDATMDCIDRYMADGTIPSTDTDSTSRNCAGSPDVSPGKRDLHIRVIFSYFVNRLLQS